MRYIACVLLSHRAFCSVEYLLPGWNTAEDIYIYFKPKQTILLRPHISCTEITFLCSSVRLLIPCLRDLSPTKFLSSGPYCNGLKQNPARLNISFWQTLHRSSRRLYQKKYIILTKNKVRLKTFSADDIHFVNEIIELN